MVEPLDAYVILILSLSRTVEVNMPPDIERRSKSGESWQRDVTFPRGKPLTSYMIPIETVQNGLTACLMAPKTELTSELNQAQIPRSSLSHSPTTCIL